jgi:RHS repeat-associated protein
MLTSVCEITGMTGSGACGQTSPQTGYWTKYSYDALGDLTGVSQNAQSQLQTRSYAFDGLGRATSEMNPESGTVTFTYDTDPTCGTSSGDLVKRLDAAGNVTCYSYDALHRVTSTTYPSGPNSANTPGKYFFYDTPCCGWNLVNTKGRLWGAHTCFSPCSSLITDEVFGYDARGEVATVYESTPHSSGYYAVSANYWANGVLETLNGLPGLPQINYGVDGAGRPYSVNAASGQNPVSSTTYNPASEPTGVTFGSSDSDSYKYDPMTGRPTEYTFSVAPPVPNTIDVRFTNDSCSGCSGNPVGGGDRNLFVNSITVGSTTIAPNDPSVSYTNSPCNGYYNGVGALACNGDLVSTNPVSSAPDSITVNAYGSPDYSIYPHMQLLINGAVSGEWDVTGSAQDYTVSTASVTGQLTWNQDGTLASLDVADPFNSANTQNCSYGYDDLARIASVNCGATWSQTFSYDPFGNIEKSGNMSFMPAYSSATNQMASIGNFTPTYDANGNVTNDGLNTFAWDANGRPTTADGVTLTYDALGRMVEQDNGGAYTEIVYGPTGTKLALMNGQSLTKAFVPLPAGATAIYNSSGLEYYRHADWLGSARLTSTPSRTVSGDVAYAPFGETYASSGSPDVSFTGQNPDTNANLYDFMYREYGIQGRWPSPDPLGPGAFNLADPQSLNLYAYVLNNPTTLIDLSGLDPCPPPYDQNTCVQVFGGGGMGGNGNGCPTTFGAGRVHLIGAAMPADFRPLWEGPPCGPSGGGGSPHGPSPGARQQPQQSPGFTLGIRAPGQTYGACMAANANTYSLGGSVELGINVATGTNTSFSSNPLVSAVTGNSINSLLFGSTADAAGTMAASAPGLVSTAMGTATTFGRRTSSIMSLNLAGAGGLPMALSPASAGVKSALGSIGNVLSLGLSFLERTAVDTAFTGAEAINCAIPQ